MKNSIGTKNTQLISSGFHDKLTFFFIIVIYLIIF